MFSDLKKLQHKYLKYLQQKTLSFPRIIHIETRSKCNGICGFCPASIFTDQRDDVYMKDELIQKIIEELVELNYCNRISFYNNNEPFLDERIFQLVRFAREKLPKAYLELKSNGIILTTEKILKIFNAGLDMLYINYYSNNSQFNQNLLDIKTDLEKIRRFKGHLEDDKYFYRIKINLRNANKVGRSRAGNSPNKKYIDKPLHRVCFRPFEMLTVNPKGNVSVCSEDFLYEVNMGNIEKQSLSEIWNSDKWNTLRYSLIMGHRNCTGPCSKCDYIGYTYEMLMENRLYNI
ncbi:MAG: radical SAM protein, partial [Candidatus Omnitrophica bacterium]|nr:radical SAM protein [Candidatus Omnitrophota bacterium]